jgi:hypothetical protein
MSPTTLTPVGILRPLGSSKLAKLVKPHEIDALPGADNRKGESNRGVSLKSQFFQVRS